QGDAPAGRRDRAIRRVPGVARPSRGRERPRSIPRPSAEGRALARMDPRARTTVPLQARAYAGGGLRVDPPRAAPDPPSRGRDVPGARDDRRARPGAAARPSLAEGGGLGEGPHLLRGGGEAGAGALRAPGSDRPLLAGARAARSAASRRGAETHVCRRHAGAGDAARLAANRTRARRRLATPRTGPSGG